MKTIKTKLEKKIALWVISKLQFWILKLIRMYQEKKEFYFSDTCGYLPGERISRIAVYSSFIDGFNFLYVGLNQYKKILSACFLLIIFSACEVSESPKVEKIESEKIQNSCQIYFLGKTPEGVTLYRLRCEFDGILVPRNYVVAAASGQGAVSVSPIQ